MSTCRIYASQPELLSEIEEDARQHWRLEVKLEPRFVAQPVGKASHGHRSYHYFLKKSRLAHGRIWPSEKQGALYKL